MALGTPQSHSPNPNPYQNPQDLSSDYIEECSDDQGIIAANMEKFKDAVIKLVNGVPNKPLSETQNSIIQDRFNRFLSVLRTPDHPPYAWMIERALREMNEEGGSSVETISDFIKKEYDDLPWSHFTLLKHHLRALCECGNIILTKGQHYLLAGVDATHNLGKKRRRKKTRRKLSPDRVIKWHKRHKGNIGKESVLQKEDQVHEKEQQGLEAEARKDTPQEDGELIEGDQTEIGTPERPPGFDPGTLKELSNLPVSCSENPSQGTKPPEVLVSAAEGLSGHQEENRLFNVYDHEEMILSKKGALETIAHQMLQNAHRMTITDGIDLQQRKNEQSPAKRRQECPMESCSPKNLPESELTKGAASISESKPVDLTSKQVTRIVFKYKKRPPLIQAAKENHLSCTIQEIKEELLQQRRLKREAQKYLDDNTIASSLLQKQLQEHAVSNTNELQEEKSQAANRSEHQGFLIPAVKPSHEEQHHPQETIGIPDSSPTASSLLQLQPQDHVILNTSKLQAVKSRSANRSKQQVLPGQTKVSCAEHHQSEAIPGMVDGPTVSSSLSICSKQSNGFQAHVFSELGASDVEEPLLTSRMLRQRKRWCKQLSNVKRSQPENQAPVESRQVTRKQANLCIQVKKNAAQPKVAPASSVALKQTDQQQFSKFASLQMHPDIEPQNQTPKHPMAKRASQEKPSCRVLRPRPLKTEQSYARISVDLSPSQSNHAVQQQHKCRGRPPRAKPESGITNDNLVAFPDPIPMQQLHKPEQKRRGRPPKSKLGCRTRMDKELVSGTQQQHTPTKRGQRRHQKEQEGE